MDFSFKKFQKEAISRLLAFDKYKYIIDNLYTCDISSDREFQKKFSAFYIVRRNEKWKKQFFSYFQSIKKRKDITFDVILKDLIDRIGKVEASFSSKLLSTINPDMPIWDRFVLERLKIKVSNNGNRIDNTIRAYEEIMRKEKELLKREDVKQSIKQFREMFPEYNFSDMKILDYMIWNNDRKKIN